MKVNTLWIDDHASVLDPEEDIDALRQQIIAAVRSGGAFAEFHTDRDVVSVLVTESVRIRIETIEREDDTGSLAGPARTSSADLDLDCYLRYR